MCEVWVYNLKELLKCNFKTVTGNTKKIKKVLKDIAELAITKKASEIPNFAVLLVKAVESSIKQQKDEKKKNIVLNAALVNQHLTYVIDEYKKINSLQWSPNMWN